MRDRCCLLVGKTKVEDCIAEFESGGKALVIGTTGRVYDLIKKGVLSTEKVVLAVLDGADAMLRHFLISQLAGILPKAMPWAMLCAQRTQQIEQFVAKHIEGVQWVEAHSLFAPDIEHLVVNMVDLAEVRTSVCGCVCLLPSECPFFFTRRPAL